MQITPRKTNRAFTKYTFRSINHSKIITLVTKRMTTLQTDSILNLLNTQHASSLSSYSWNNSLIFLFKIPCLCVKSRIKSITFSFGILQLFFKSIYLLTQMLVLLNMLRYYCLKTKSIRIFKLVFDFTIGQNLSTYSFIKFFKRFWLNKDLGIELFISFVKSSH